MNEITLKKEKKKRKDEERNKENLESKNIIKNGANLHGSAEPFNFIKKLIKYFKSFLIIFKSFI